MEEKQCLPVDIIIPFYKHEELVPLLFNALYSLADELNQMHATLILINDSPNYPPLVEALKNACAQCDAYKIAFHLLINDKNMGFLKTTNRGLRLSHQLAHDVILLNSDAIPTKGSLKEIQRIAYSDPAIGFVSPRSNNAVLCSLPNQEDYASNNFEQAYAQYKSLQPCLPELTYVPTVVGFCMFIKSAILKQIGFLDEIYGHGYYEEYDYVFRGGRGGYKAALANYAYVYHKGAASISSIPSAKDTLLKKNKAVFEARYPEYIEAMDAYYKEYYKAERMLCALLDNSNKKKSIIFDFTHLGFIYGPKARATKLIVNILSKKLHQHFTFFVTCSLSVWTFHQLSKLKYIHFAPLNTPIEGAISCKVISQSLSIKELKHMSHLAMHNIYFILNGRPKKIIKNKAQQCLWHFLDAHAHCLEIEESSLEYMQEETFLELINTLINRRDLILNQIILRMHQVSFLSANMS